ncbi:MAG TPA: cytochrome ubiquinol oxidase subunit I [Gemmatimonadales bacterium]|jgi:cytochrome d ubiquinol oxidase subunit I|nr:cytochrome ubiquinol oxidase subunit I [Gemmatimonadales bacterium]
MSDLLAARSQMAVSLYFHILFAVAGIGMPLLMVVAEWRYRRTGDPVSLDLAKRWGKGTAILFAVGAVSGTVLSFELGLLWPRFMELAGPVIGMPFSLEGFAFFLEGIFIGVYLYGWDRISPRAHLLAGVMVAVSGAASGVFVVIANAWMNAPTGFDFVQGRLTHVDPIAGMLNPMAFQQTLHMTIASYAATGFAVAGIHAFLLLIDRTNAFHRRALAVALLVGAPAAVLQPLSGDLSARAVAVNQPAKLAAMESHFETARRVPLVIGGIPDLDRRETRYAIRIPGGLSLLAFHDLNARVTGLEEFPRADWPNVAIVHTAFQLMVGLGTLLALLALWVGFLAIRRRDLSSNVWLLRALALAAPVGFICIEAGWTVTEVGRQPWVVYGILRTADAVTPMPGLIVPFLGFSLLYCFLGIIVVWLLYRQIIRSPRPSEWTRTYAPPSVTRA